MKILDQITLYNDTQILTGSGDPNGAVTATRGSTYTNSAAGTLWVKTTASGNTGWVDQSAASSTGDVVGPASSADNAVVRFDGTTGKLVQNSSVTVSDTGVVTATTFSGSGASLTSIPNGALTNSTITVGSTAISLGSSATTIAGLSSVTSTTFVGALTGNASTATTATNATNVAITHDAASTTGYIAWVGGTGNQATKVTNTKLTYNASTGALALGTGSLSVTGTVTATTFSGSGASLTSIPNGALTNSTITIGSTAISLGSSATTITGLTSVTSTTFVGALTGNASTATSATSATTATTATNATNTAITDDTTTNASMYLTWVTATSGNLPQKVSGSGKLWFNPSTGTLGATVFNGLGTYITGIPQASVTNLTTDLGNKAIGIASATDNRIVRFDGTGGKQLQQSPVSISDTGVISGVADGLISSDAVTLSQMNTAISAAAAGLDVKQSVRVATTANISLSSAPSSIDGVTLASANRILVKNQSTASENGIYEFESVGNPLSRTPDATTFNAGMYTFVEEGTQADTGWVLTTNNPITVGTTGLTFTQFSGIGEYIWGNGLSNSGQTVNVGAGTGISVAADTVGIDTAVVARKYSTSVGNASATSFTVTHNLGTRDVNVSVVESSGNYAVGYTEWRADTTNSIIVYFTNPPASNAYRVNVVG